ncbi:hypothetical protein KR093_003590 [Drosophila rubida]|uniref:Uncharacterized protein n=1 Tax=Drosophila rubida TaxID=30044 RepID=A0AAD4PJB0_9MUSC|nr:hypothetical protein KR093_003590 [Drosophila rubida]
MKLLGVGMQLMKRHQTTTCGCQQSHDALPPCPRKPFWTAGRALFFSTLTFGAGVYTGIYVSQNYEVPRVDNPQKLVERMNEKFRELVDGKKK